MDIGPWIVIFPFNLLWYPIARRLPLVKHFLLGMGPLLIWRHRRHLDCLYPSGGTRPLEGDNVKVIAVGLTGLRRLVWAAMQP
jgi:hypothetical protein